VLTRARRPDPVPLDQAPTIFSSFDFSGGAVVAVSGGSDSIALLLLLKSYLERRHPAAPLLAVTIDHALRIGSAAEAEAVARLCAAHGIAHRTIAWSGPKPATGMPAAAREARYRLLAEAARDAGIGLIATGHTADDQAETVWMRQARSPDADAHGLAGMAPTTLYDSVVWIVRPLLETRRQALRDLLRGRDIGWIDDPTNADSRFERARLREETAGDDVRIGQALATAANAGREREALARRAASLLKVFASLPAPGLVRLGPGFAHADDRAAATQVLRTLLAIVGGATFLPAKESVEALLASLATGKARATLSRCVVDTRRAGIFLHRERRDLPPPCEAMDGMVWDGRRRITFNDADGSLVIAPLGAKAAEAREIEPSGAPPSLKRAALAAEPAFWRGTECMGAIEAGEKGRSEPVMAPWRLFLPSFDLGLARAVAKLIDAPPMPEPSFSDPIGVEPWSNA
jgi:tRNA(Ile)-lysidine synthase